MRFLPLLLFFLIGCAGYRGPGSIDDRPAFDWRRVTSVDPEGGNADFRTLEPRGELVLADLEGPGRITRLWVTYNRPEELDTEGLVLEMTWDDAPGPSVRVPLDMFFGLGREDPFEFENAYQHVTANESLNAFFPMPFRERATIRVVNETAVRIPQFYWAVEYEAHDSRRSLGDAGYLHAMYRHAYPPAQREPYAIASLEGRGVYIGTSLWLNLNVPGWWGEGDDILVIDGERFQGTGSEEFFGGAWGWGNRVAEGLRFGVPRLETPGERGGSWVVYRFHKEAPMRFDESFELLLEHGQNGFHGRPVAANHYASVAFYYMDEPQGQEALPPLEERLADLAPIAPPTIGRWHEAEEAHATGHLFTVEGGVVYPREYPESEANAWSGGADVAMVGFRTGSRFVWAIPIREAGVYTAELAHTLQSNGYIYELRVNGETWVEAFDGYAPDTRPATMELPPVALDRGMAMLEVIVTGSNPEAQEPALFAGMDAIRFTPLLGEAEVDARLRVPDPQTVRGLVHYLDFESDGEAARAVDRAHPGDGVTMEGAGSFALAPGPDGRHAAHLDGKDDRLLFNADAIRGLGNDMAIDAYIRPGADRNPMVVLSRGLVLFGSIDEQKPRFWIRDEDFRFLSIQCFAPVVMPDAWSRLGLVLEDDVAEIRVNGATVQVLDMENFRRVNVYPGRTMVGSSESNLGAFRGAMGPVILRTLDEPAAP